MTDKQTGLLAIGAGPANLALAVAIEESGSAGLAAETLLLEQSPDIRWQRDLLMPWARSQVSFLKDLVTLRNPRSRFSFLSFLHDHDRLDEFVNLGTFNPFRWEISDYLQWVAHSLERVRIRFGARAQRIEPVRDRDGSVSGWVVTLTDGDTIRCRDLVIGGGRDPRIPAVFADLPPDRVIHSAQYRTRIAQLPREAALRAVVVGGAQSAAEMFLALHENLPQSKLTMVVRSVGLQNYQTSKFVNELFYPSFVDRFHASPPEVRRQLLEEMHLTNYAGLAPPFVDQLYTMLYQQRGVGQRRSEVRPLTEVVGARVEGEEVVLDLRDRTSGQVEPLRCDVVLLGTGYDQRMPAMVRNLAARVGLAEISVNRRYRVDLGGSAWGAMYLQGVNEATHGIADSLISVLANRSQDIVDDLLARREPRQRAEQRPAAGERLVVISPAPTANGDLHVGHLAGPFLAADVCTRYARAAGREALYGTGMHFTQNYVVTAARRLGMAPEDLRVRSAAQVEQTLDALGIEVDGFGCIGDRFVTMVLDFYRRLHRQGKLKLRTVRFPYLPSTDEYLMDAYVTGGCPFCLAEGYAGICESCGLPVAPGDLIDPRSTLHPQEKLESREAEILVFPVEEYRTELVEYFARTTMRPHMAQMIEGVLSRPLPDFPITQPTQWGIPAPFSEVPGQVIYPHMEGMPWSMFTTALAAERRGLALNADDELWRADSGTTVVYFLGLDATYPFAVVGTAMLAALGGYVLPAQYITNDFYELANEKFSTSRGHVVSGRELAKEMPRDLIRFHLSATSPEFQRTDFTREALVRVTESRLVGPWNRVAAAVEEWVGRGPLPVSARSRRSAQRTVERFADGYDLRRFSLTAVASTLAEQLARLDRMAESVSPQNAGDFCHQVEVFLRCAAPILIDLAAAALPDTAIPAQQDAVTVTPVRLPRLTGAGS